MFGSEATDFVITSIIDMGILAFIIATMISRRLIGKKSGRSKFLRGSILFLAIGTMQILLQFLSTTISGSVNLLNLINGLLFNCLYINSRIYFGDKGISVPRLPFYTSKEDIIAYRIKNGKLIIGRKDKKAYSMMINMRDIGMVEEQMKKMKIRRQ
ncbi:MAG TPA: hypothetical protein VIK72_10325 [Clostridiaceae bacterium]